jgi:putative endonuclease
MKKENQWVVYIIQTTSGKLYTGITNNLERRFSEHLNSKKGAKFFNLSSPKSIIFHEKHPNRSSATQREIEIKKMSRQKKLALIT